MAKFQGWKKRYSYLDDYKPGIDGKYVYYGRHYVLKSGKGDWKNYRLLISGAAVIVLALLVVSGLIEAGTYWRQWYVNLTYALKVIAAFLIIWKCFTLVTEKYPVKEYLYKKSVPWYKPSSVSVAATGLVSAIAAAVCLAAPAEGTIVSGCIIELVLNLLTCAAGIVMFKLVGKYEWEPDPSEEIEA